MLVTGVIGWVVGLGLVDEVAVGAKAADQGMAFHEAEVGLFRLTAKELLDPLVAPTLSTYGHGSRR